MGVFTCKRLIIQEFNEKVKSGMVSAELLYERKHFKQFALSTIRTNLSVLKNEKKLMIAFRRKGKMAQDPITAEEKFFRGVCYYKLA